MKDPDLIFSIIIPTYNRPQKLTTCLESLTYIDYPRDRFEVIIVDDGSDQVLDSLIEPYHNLLNITLIRQKNAGPAKARNTGVNVAKGKYIAFTDDDCIADSHWLSVLEKAFINSPNALVGGKTINVLSDNPYSTASQLLIDYLYEYYNHRSEKSQFFASNNFAISRELFNHLGQFDLTFPLAAGEDREFCDRCLFKGYSLSYVPQALIYHAHYLNFRKFWQQHFNYGCGAFFFRQLHAQRTNKTIKIEPLTFYRNLLIYPFFSQSKLFKLFLSALLVISQVANAIGFFITKFSSKNRVSINSKKSTDSTNISAKISVFNLYQNYNQ